LKAVEAGFDTFAERARLALPIIMADDVARDGKLDLRRKRGEPL